MQVCGVLESLEQEYRREEDWCGGGDRQPEHLLPLINKHMEQKEAFLKVSCKAVAPHDSSPGSASYNLGL